MTEIKIGNKIIGPGHPTYIIAEIGSNHDGSLERAKELIVAAAGAGANAVKFQSFEAENMVSPGASENYAKAFQTLKKLELKQEWHLELKNEAEQQNIEFLSAPFSIESARLLNKIRVAAIKIASGDLTHHSLIKEVASFGKPVILSTGAATMGEIGTSVDILETAGNKKLTIMHCVSSYPLKAEEANLRAITTLSNAFKYPVGFSDHSSGWALDIAAILLGASIIEKHMTFDRSLPGPDHGYALTNNEFSQMVSDIREVESAMGNGNKQPSVSEFDERIYARRGLYAATNIYKGTTIKREMLRSVRPQFGIPANQIDMVCGRIASQDINEDTPLKWKFL